MGRCVSHGLEGGWLSGRRRMHKEEARLAKDAEDAT